MRSLALLLFLALCAAPTLAVGSNKCTWGPSYWCSSEDAAHQCNTLLYCQSKGLLLNVSTANKPSPVECKLCHLVVDNVVKNLTSNSTVEEIEEALDKVCLKLGAFAAVCQDFVLKYTPELVAVLSRDLNATAVCIKLHFCPNSTLYEMPAHMVVKELFATNAAAQRAAPSPAECRLCKFIIGQLDGQLTKNATVEEIEQALDKVCSKLGAFASVCDNLVAKYTPELIAVLLQDLNASAVCIKAGICPKPSHAATPSGSAASLPLAVQETLALGGGVGTQRCTEGPAYWCANKAQAHECKALQYCQTTVWSRAAPPQ